MRHFMGAVSNWLNEIWKHRQFVPRNDRTYKTSFLSYSVLWSDEVTSHCHPVFPVTPQTQFYTSQDSTSAPNRSNARLPHKHVLAVLPAWGKHTKKSILLSAWQSQLLQPRASTTCDSNPHPKYFRFTSADSDSLVRMCVYIYSFTNCNIVTDRESSHIPDKNGYFCS
jgi:hypothetical protein